MKIDLHVHSVYSNRPGELMLKAVRSAECYTSPRRVYDIATSRGMDMVTLTDHDTIDGALDIAHLEGAFVSEEITATFPEDGVKAHIVALDISEVQHASIAKCRKNIYALTTYLRDENIPHFAAHPLSGADAPFQASHVQKLILLFRHLEGINGTRDPATAAALQRILSRITQADIDRWADRYGIEPVADTPVRFLTGGSDDHGALSIARAYTTLDSLQPTRDAFRGAFFKGSLSPAGRHGSGDVLGHNIYSVTLQYFQHTDSRSGFSALLDEKAPTPPSNGRALRNQSIRNVVSAHLGALEKYDLDTLINRSHEDIAQACFGRMGRAILRDLFKRFVDDMFDAFGELDLDSALDAVPGVLSAASMMLPYLFGYRYLIRDRETADAIAREIDADATGEKDFPKVAIFSDTGVEINGVALGLNRLIDAMNREGGAVDLVLCQDPEKPLPDHLAPYRRHLVRLPPIRSFTLPIYGEYRLGIPSLVDVMDYLADAQVTVVQVSTPGPLGLTALLAAKLCNLEVVANYHTEIGEYTRRLTGDATFSQMVDTLVAAFYRQADAVIAPSFAVIERLVRMGVPRDRIRKIPRGVDSRRFRPGPDIDAGKRLSSPRPARLLYVGRLSKEKGLDTLISAFERLTKKGVKATLDLVGDGPYRESLAHRCDESVHFLGYRVGDALAAIYASADIFVFPSATDTFGNVVLEAHAAGLPAVVVNSGGPMEQVTHGKTGLIVEKENPEALAEALAALVSHPSRCTRMGRLARQRALKLTHEASARAHLAFYRDIRLDRKSISVLKFRRQHRREEGRACRIQPSRSSGWDKGFDDHDFQHAFRRRTQNESLA